MKKSTLDNISYSKARLKEYKKAIFTMDRSPILAEDYMRHNHAVDLAFDRLEIIDREQWNKKLLLAAWHSMLDYNTITNTLDSHWFSRSYSN